MNTDWNRQVITVTVQNNYNIECYQNQYQRPRYVLFCLWECAYKRILAGNRIAIEPSLGCHGQPRETTKQLLGLCP